MPAADSHLGNTLFEGCRMPGWPHATHSERNAEKVHHAHFTTSHYIFPCSFSLISKAGHYYIIQGYAVLLRPIVGSTQPCIAL